MDERWALPLLLTPVAVVVAAYLLAWRGRKAEIRKFGAGILAAFCGLVALFGSWWALGMTYGIWFDYGSVLASPRPTEVLLAVVVEAFILLLPSVMWYLCVRYARIAAKQH